MPINVPIVSASGAKSTVAVPDPVVTGTVQTFNIGDTLQYTSPDNGDANYVCAGGPFTLSVPATPTSVSFYVTTPAGQMYLGIFDNTGAGGKPGKKVATTAVFASAGGWNTRPTVSPVQLPAGQYYLGFLSSATVGCVHGGTGTIYFSNTGAFTPLPATFPANPLTDTAFGHWSLYATFTSGPPPPPDTTAPSAPTNLVATPSSNSVALTWTAATDNVGVTGYVLTRNGVQVATPTGSPYTDSGLNPSTSYAYTLAAVDAAGNKSVAVSVSTTTTAAPPPGSTQQYWQKWSNGPKWTDNVLPIGAWNAAIDDPAVAPYADLGAGLKDAGVNLMLSTWDWQDTRGPQFLERAKTLGLVAIVSSDTMPDLPYLQANPTHAGVIVGWSLGDEFDQLGAPGSATIVNNMYKAAVAKDPTRPMHINYGKGIGFVPGVTQSYGQASNSEATLYLQSCDSVSVDYYWWSDHWGDMKGAFGYGLSLDSLRRAGRLASTAFRPLWGFVENSRIDDQTTVGITPDKMEAAIWSLIVHGARGVMYFIHDFAPGGTSGDGIWGRNYYDRNGANAIIARMKTVNARLQSLAPIINSPEIGSINSLGRESASNFVTVGSTGNIPIDLMARKYGGDLYVFAQATGNMSNFFSGNTTGTFTIMGGGSPAVTVRDESRTVAMTNGVFTDTFSAYQLHVYVIRGLG